MARADMRDFSGDTVIGDIGRRWAVETPEKVAIDDGTTAFSYRSLNARVDNVALHLADLGIQKGDCISVLLPGGCDYIVAALAIARAGAVLCPLNPRLASRELLQLARDAGPAVLITTADQPAVLGDPEWRELMPRERMISLSDVAATCEPRAPARSVADPDDVYTLMFTSGTTSTPKGALATHRARMIWIKSAMVEYDIREHDVYLSAMPLVHSAGLTFALMHLHAGAYVRLVPKFESSNFLELMRTLRVTSVLAVPTMLQMLVTALGDVPFDGVALRRLITCGAPLSPVTKQAVLTRISPKLFDFYGCTECNSMTLLRPSDQASKPRSVGRPFIGVEIVVAGTSGEVLPPHEIGEIWCKNPSSMLRYLNRPEATAAAFFEGWYRTGDLGYIDEDGFLHLSGRKHEMIISGGINIFPPEIEGVLLEHPAVADCAVVGIPDETWGETVKAVVALREGASLTLADLQAHCAGLLADFKKPRGLEIVVHIPRNAGGKVVRSALKAIQNGMEKS